MNVSYKLSVKPTGLAAAAAVIVTACLAVGSACSDDDNHPVIADGATDATLDGATDAATDGQSDGDIDGATDGAPPQQCTLDYDCPPGDKCRLGYCEPFTPECDAQNPCPGAEVCLDGVCREEGFSPHLGAILVNEVLTDGDTDGDANEDGTTDSMEDEFVELVNVSNQTIDLSGWMLVETDWGQALPRHTFEAQTLLDPLDVIVVFGGGAPPQSTTGVTYLTANAQDPGIPFGLDLDDGGDVLRLQDGDGLTVFAFTYGDEGGIPAPSDQAVTRDPDLTGDFTFHSEVANAGGALFSPGTRSDGTPF